jgi:hypothetical protein
MEVSYEISLNLNEHSSLIVIVDREIENLEKDLAEFSSNAAILEYARARLIKFKSIKSKLDNSRKKGQ